MKYHVPCTRYWMLYKEVLCTMFLKSLGGCSSCLGFHLGKLESRYSALGKNFRSLETEHGSGSIQTNVPDSIIFNNNIVGMKSSAMNNE